MKCGNLLVLLPFLLLMSACSDSKSGEKPKEEPSQVPSQLPLERPKGQGASSELKAYLKEIFANYRLDFTERLAGRDPVQPKTHRQRVAQEASLKDWTGIESKCQVNRTPEQQPRWPNQKPGATVHVLKESAILGSSCPVSVSINSSMTAELVDVAGEGLAKGYVLSSVEHIQINERIVDSAWVRGSNVIESQRSIVKMGAYTYNPAMGQARVYLKTTEQGHLVTRTRGRISFSKVVESLNLLLRNGTDVALVEIMTFPTPYGEAKIHLIAYDSTYGGRTLRKTGELFLNGEKLSQQEVDLIFDGLIVAE